MNIQNRPAVDLERNLAQARAWLEIDLDRLAQNVTLIRNSLPDSCLFTAVVKADAYGHGAAAIVPTLLANGADRLAVATLAEAIELRREGITAPVLILGPVDAQYLDLLITYDLTATICSQEQGLKLAAACAQQPRMLRVHLKIETGMNRLGLLPNVETVELIKLLNGVRNIFLEGLFTHFSQADDQDDAFTLKQFRAFEQFKTLLAAEGLKFSIEHVCNSMATLRFLQMHLDMVRCGLICYGLYPQGREQYLLGLKPIMSLRCRVVQTRTVPAGSKIGYGGLYKTGEERTIATLAIGYADGYPRRLAGRAHVLIRGQRVPVVGSICMDLCMVDVTELAGPAVASGEVATLFGEWADAAISVDTVAAWQETINYEVTCQMGRRLPRIYKGGV